MYDPTGFPLQIFKDRYAFTPDEPWLGACSRVAQQASLAEIPEKQKLYLEKFYDVLANNLFVPGGRIWANSGRPNASMLNCFVLDPEKDSAEGWAASAYNMIITAMRGGGCGDDFSDVRPRGASIAGQRGLAPGAVELMRLINACAQPVRNGGQRRVALMFSLDLSHPDIVEFLNSKLIMHELTHANISVRSKHTKAFIKAIKDDDEIELQWKGKYKQTIKARTLWNVIATNAYNSAEPGFLNWELVEHESNIYYIENLVTTNPCFAPETLVTTDKGVFPIHTLVGKTVRVRSNGVWVSVSNFRVTGHDQSILKVTLSDGSSIRLTPQHTVVLESGARVAASELCPGDRLKIGKTETHGTHHEPGAYIKGFMTGDGCASKGNPLLWLYTPKFCCQDRLIKSASELTVITSKRSDAVQQPSCGLGTLRRQLRGLVVRPELLLWGTEYKRQLPLDVLTWDTDSKLEFIAGVMDADGSAQDSPGFGFRYQISSIHREWLLSFQMLLKTIGVHSKLGLMKKAQDKDFRHRGGVLKTQDCWRLTISQVSSVALARQVRFSRLVSFENKDTAYKTKPTFNRVVSVIPDGREGQVYCCTIPKTHSFVLACGVEMANCGELALATMEPCCLGHIVLSRFVVGGSIDYPALGNTIRLAVRFLDNILSVNHFPLQEMKDKSESLRRIGLGTTALADTLAMLGYRYGSEEGNKFIDKLYRFISKAAYEASMLLAVEKGTFPLCEPEKHIESGFMKRMPEKIKALVKENGLRNCAILTQAPTGTVSILSGNCSAGIEPMFAPAYERRYWEGETRRTQLVFHPLFEQFMAEGKNVDHFIGAHDLSMRDHLEVQKIVQRHTDNAVSKTINISAETPLAEMEQAWLEYLPFLKGTTFYRETTRGYVNAEGVVELPPLTAISLEDAKARFTETHLVGTEEVVDCPSGTCVV